MFPWPGHERIVAGIDFLKAINKGENPRVGRNVIVIGCGNAGMDAAAGAYAMGAESVTCIDVQKPAAFAHEIAHIEALGGKLLWPVMTKEITDGGLITADGTLISGDMVIITIGESPDLGYLPEGVRKFPRLGHSRGGYEPSRKRVCGGRRDQARIAGGRHRNGKSRRLRPLTPRFAVWPMRPSRRNRYPQGN